MKVAVVEFAGRGGLMHYTFQLCRAMAEAGAEVTLVTDQSYEMDGLRQPFRVERLLRLWDAKPAGEPGGSPAARLLRKARRPLRALRYWREWLRLIGWLRRERPDVVQFGDVRFAIDLPFFWLLRRTGIPMADVCHNVRPFRRRGALTAGSTWNGRLYRALYALFDRVFVHFEANRRAFQDDFALPAERVATILHGNQDVFRELGRRGRPVGALRAELGLSPEHRVILFFGTLSRYKGTDLLLDAFPGILAREPRAVLVLAGFPLPGFDLEAHREEARRLGIEECVRFHARYLPSEDVPAWMALADVVAYPYRTVFQSGAIHLAQTFGRPIVASRVGAFPEVVEHGGSGLLIPPDDPAALRDAVSLMLARPDMARSMGRRAARDAAVRFDWMRPAGIVLGEYGRLLGRAAANGMPGEEEE